MLYYYMRIEKVKNIMQISADWQGLWKEGLAFYAFRSAVKEEYFIHNNHFERNDAL